VGANIAKTKDVIVDIIPFDKELVAKKLSESTNLSSVGINTIKNILSTTTNIGATLGLTLVITFLMLLYRNRIKRFATMITRSENHGHITSIVHRSFSVMPRYMAGILTVVIIMTILNTIGFMIIGTPSPLFWGLMVSLLNVIPYVGPAIGFGAAALFSLLVAGPTVAVLAMIMFLVIQFIDNNLLTPMIAGSQININALAAIISLVVWGMIWGMVGMVLALPILGLIKIICDEIPELHAIGYLIGDKE
jgi:predicted PurR-regulated permease PerM